MQYLFTSTSASNPLYSQLLYLIGSHPSFKEKVNSFLPLFPYKINPESVIKMGSLIMAAVLPDYPKNIQRKIAVELFNSIEINQEEVTYTHLSQYLLRFCSSLVENLDVRSAIGILDVLQSRIIDYYIIDAADEEFMQKLQTSMKLQIFDPETIITETELLEKFHRRAGELTYYQEKIVFEDPKSLTPTQLKIKKLKDRPEEVIPIGYIFEEFCLDFVNNNFEARHSYRLKGNKNVLVNDKIDYWATVNENAGNMIRDNIVNQQIYQTCSVISNTHLPQEITPPQSKMYNMYRINIAFAAQNYYQRLKQLPENPTEESKTKHFNILSQYFERNQFNIDEIALTKEKLIVRRKEHLLGITGKESVKKEVKDYQVATKQLVEKINKYQYEFLDEARTQRNKEELAKTLRMVIQEGKNINLVLEKNLSAFEELPKDPADPFKEDIINFANIPPIQSLIIGRAKSGKSTLAKQIAKIYSLVYVSIESVLDKVIERAKNFKENPPEPDEDGNIKDGLLKIEECILSDLEQGKCIENEDILDLINVEMKRPETLFKGFIIDLPFEYDEFWYKAIIENRVFVPKIKCRFFNRIIQIDQNQQQWAHFLKGLMLRPEDLTTSSTLDRYLQKKPKPPPEEGQQEEEPANDEQKPPPLIESNLLNIKWQKNALPLIEHLTLHINPLHYLKINNSFQSIQECMEGLKAHLYKIPHAKKLEGAQKELLTVGLEEQKVVRKWSPWGLVDCVELHRSKLMMGKFQNAAEYAGRVFVFQNENNLGSFLAFPRQYLQKLPTLPQNTNICITGPRKSGKKTLAKLLSDLYGLKIIDFEQILGRVIKKQQGDETHIPSNPDRTSRSVHLSEPEFKEFYKGGALSAKNILPIILFELGIPLQKKPPGWGIEKTDEEGGVEQPVEEKKPPPKKAKKKDKNQDERPKTPPLEDIGLKDIIPKINFKKKLDEIRGFILVGFPNNQDQINALKAFNIPIDKLILLSDNSEENPFKNLAKRLTESQMQQVANFMTNFAPVKEAVGEQNVKQITNLDQTPEEILNKIRQFIDPFYPKVDDDAINRVCADKPEEGDPIPMGFCGDYCPVTLADGWLIKGKQQFESGFEGRRFKFVGENEMNLFKENPTKFIKKQNLEIAPRIMFMGLRGVGLKTQLMKINQSYRVPIINFKQTLIQLLENQKAKRKSERYYNKGFKIPEYDQEGKLVEDPELNDDGAEFDRAAVEVQCVKKMFSGINEIFMNGNYYDVEEDVVSTPFVDLLAQARKLPEVVFMLKSNEQKWLQRNLDRKKIEEELEEIKEKRRLQKLQEREQARKKAEEAGEQYQEPPEQEEQDPEIPKLQDLIAQKQQALKGQREADAGKLEELVETFKSWNVQVIEVNCERDVKHVFDRINYSLKPYMNERMNKWEQNNMLVIERYRAPDFINNYIASNSRFGDLNPFTLLKQVSPFPLIYKDRIYYLKDEEERDRVMRNPQLLYQNKGTPEDIRVAPHVAVIGQTKTGKSTLAANICKKLGTIHLTVEQIIEQFTQEHRDNEVEAIMKYLKEGNCLTDEQLVQLIQKRISMNDCQHNGWVFDGFPMNKVQCDLLNKRNLLPVNVFSLKLKEIEIKKRVIAQTKHSASVDYDFDMEVVHERIDKTQKDLTEVEIYFMTKFNSLEKLDAKISKWGLLEIAEKKIEQKVKGRKSLIRALVTHSATPASDIGLDFNCIVNQLSEFGNYNPISYKIRREYIKLCPKHHKNLALYQKKIYLFSTESQMNDFISNPENYKKKGTNFSPPQLITAQNMVSIVDKVQNKKYCPVELTRKKLVKGNPLYTVKYHDKFFMISSPTNLKLFLKNPVMFELAKIPDKLPVQFQKKSDLKKIAKKNDCTAFLEHHLSNILMKCLAQLGYRRPKYPTLGSKETALKFLALSLKAINPNKDEQYRQKYNQKLNSFIKECSYSQQLREELDRKDKGNWQDYDEQNLIKLCEEYNQFLEVLNSSDKNKYFSQFIR